VAKLFSAPLCFEHWVVPTINYFDIIGMDCLFIFSFFAAKTFFQMQKPPKYFSFQLAKPTQLLMTDSRMTV